MDFAEFKAGKDDHGRRLDKVIRILIPHLTLAQIYKNIRTGFLKVNGKKTKYDYKVCDGDIIQAAEFLVNQVQSDASQNEVPLTDSQEALRTIDSILVFENEHILILNKPANMNVHSAKKDEVSLKSLVESYYNEYFKNKSLSFRPGPLHRIDRFTSGLVCFSKSLQGANWFSNNMQEHKIKKTYYAILQGTLKHEQNWQDYLEKEKINTGFHTVKVYAKDDKALLQDAKLCITNVEPLKTGKINGIPLTYARVMIETGRQHQIRAQSAFNGYPLWGDDAYGASARKNEKFMLCSAQIEFPPNELDIPTVLKIELPQEFKNIVEKLED